MSGAYTYIYAYIRPRSAQRTKTRRMTVSSGWKIARAITTNNRAITNSFAAAAAAAVQTQ